VVENLTKIVLLLLFPVLVFGQYEEYLQADPEPTMHKQAGFAFSVIETGTGIGGFYNIPLKNFIHIGLAANVFLLRDKNQIDIYDPYTGYPITIGKKNNVYLLDFLFSVKKRLFPRSIDDNLRPFLALSVGPVYGMNFPGNKDIKDEFSWAANLSGAMGVEVILNDNYLFGMRLQYRYMKFGRIIGEKKDHSTVDVRIEIGKVF